LNDNIGYIQNRSVNHITARIKAADGKDAKVKFRMLLDSKGFHMSPSDKIYTESYYESYYDCSIVIERSENLMNR